MEQKNGVSTPKASLLDKYVSFHFSERTSVSDFAFDSIVYFLEVKTHCRKPVFETPEKWAELKSSAG